MSNDIASVGLQIAIMIALSYPLGIHIAKVFKGGKDMFRFLEPFENRLYIICSINSNEQMNWKKFLYNFQIINSVWLIWGIVLLITQGSLPLNPNHNPSQTLSLAFNTSVSFLANCNLQHYSGETEMTYFTQVFVVMLFQFLSAASGMAAFAGIIKAIDGRSSGTIGNFWVYFVRSITRVLLPLTIVVAVILIFCGVPMSFTGYVSQGPVAAIEAIKQLGTNGGGFFGANSAHPLENPSYLSNMVECISIMLIPMSLIWTFGKYTGKMKLASCIFAVMLFAYLGSVAIGVKSEMKTDNEISSMEGKEVRIGKASTALWAMTTTATSNGSSNCSIDKLSPLTRLMALANMQTNCWFGGIGAGFMNYYVFIIIAVFISGLMVGRTPELLGRKIEANEMKIAIIVALIHPFLILSGTAISALTQLGPHTFHTFCQMLYEFTSASANNGSGMNSLSYNNAFWNISTGVVMLIGRYVPIIGQIAIAGMLSEKKQIPESAGTLKTDTITFSIMTFAVIIIVAVLSFFPALTLGPIAELIR